jgi:GNAT superfamily N-acetyltransferase
VVEPLEPDLDVEAAVTAARSVAREYSKPILAWWLAPEHAGLGPKLEELGLVNEDTPGFEAVENAMALLAEPSAPSVDDVEVRAVKTLEEYVAVSHVGEEAFGLEPTPEAELRLRFEELQASPRAVLLLASIGGRPVGSAFAALGDAGVNLFGGSVHPDARGRGVYRALTAARWQLAVERGTPALTVQAGRMSMPICEQLGFRLVERVRLYVDQVPG